MRFQTSLSIILINRILHSCSSINEFNKLVAKKEINCSASLLAFYLFNSTRLINSIKHEHSCKILCLSKDVASGIDITTCIKIDKNTNELHCYGDVMK